MHLQTFDTVASETFLCALNKTLSLTDVFVAARGAQRERQLQYAVGLPAWPGVHEPMFRSLLTVGRVTQTACCKRRLHLLRSDAADSRKVSEVITETTVP